MLYNFVLVSVIQQCESWESVIIIYVCVFVCVYTCMHACVLSRFSHVLLFANLWTLARQASLSVRFSRQEYWSGLPCPLPGDLPDSGIKPVSLMSLALAGGFFTTSATWEAHFTHSSVCVSIANSQSIPCFPLPMTCVV